MARKKTSLASTSRRPPVLKPAAPVPSGARQPLGGRQNVRRSAAGVERADVGGARPAPADSPHHEEEARRDAIASMLLQLVGAHTRVLVIGCDTWPLSRSLASVGCRVSVVETRQDVPAGSATFSDRVIVGDPEALDLTAALGAVQFDSILAVRLLEHARNPIRLLKTLRSQLSANGAILAAVPNVMHGRIRLGFLRGRSPAELLAPDAASPPSHWYDAAALQRTFERASFAITRLERLTETFDPSAAALGDTPLPPQLVDGLLQDADAMTRTFVAVAHPLPLTGQVLLEMRVRELAQAHERALQQMNELADRGAERDARHAELQRALDGAVGQMDRIGADLQLATARDGRLQLPLAAARQRLLSDRGKVEAIGRNLKDFRYEQLILRMRALVERTLPTNALALVVSKGDERLLSFEGRKAWHFLRNEQGVYAGHHPADSAAAIEALERWRAAGATYLVVPQASFWWLDHYAALRDHLGRRGRLVVRDERTAAIYALGKRERQR